MPSPDSVISEEEYNNTIETLTTYNTLSYLSNIQMDKIRSPQIALSSSRLCTFLAKSGA